MDATVDTTEASFLRGLVETLEMSFRNLRGIKRSLFGCQMTIALAVEGEKFTEDTGQYRVGSSREPSLLILLMSINTSKGVTSEELSTSRISDAFCQPFAIKWRGSKTSMVLCLRFMFSHP